MPEDLPLFLVCDDDEDDQLLLKSAFDEVRVEADFVFASDGKELIDYLQGANNNRGKRLPKLIVLDLNMPKMSGFQVLD